MTPPRVRRLTAGGGLDPSNTRFMAHTTFRLDNES